MSTTCLSLRDNASLAEVATPDDDDTTLAITANEDGGYRVTWIAKSNDGSDTGRIVSREFDADGNAVGTAIDLSAADIPGLVAADAAGSEGSVAEDLQLVELGGGGFAALIQLDVEANLTTFVNSVASSGPQYIFPPQGRLDTVQLTQVTA